MKSIHWTGRNSSRVRIGCKCWRNSLKTIKTLKRTRQGKLFANGMPNVMNFGKLEYCKTQFSIFLLLFFLNFYSFFPFHNSLATKKVFNKQFGSVFRTYNNPTYFSRRLFRFSDIYTSNISNLVNYSTSHTFYTRRGVMPHEYSSLFL